ncbi:hypothetical protein [Shimia abyssi]|uniref:Porin-like protein n=1 Tax=Shimia abyssi TaxID=1662395 RepID=A0A2P8F5X3_9RHOB|nr:hypothetical protein [Shimia abyssi]PSL17111.1 hypothetical protein CLV88_12121 [Shimia abyssi]
MFKISTASAATITMLATHPANAVEITGGSIKLGYSQFTNQTTTGQTLSNTTLDTSTELGFNRNTSAQLDLGLNSYGASNFDGHNVALHGIYHANETTSFGAFIGQDGLESNDVNFAGFELGVEAQALDLETFFMTDIDNNSDGRIFGISGDYEITDSFEVTGQILLGDFGNLNFDRYSVGVRYKTSNSFALTADLGAARAEAFGVSDSETFIALGAEYKFGAERGATFGKRSLLSVIPGL